MQKKLEQASGKARFPSYLPIYNKLYTEIVRGDYPPGSKLPGENLLAKRYTVSRNTVREALTVLVEDGLIVKQQGRGTFVAPERSTPQPEGRIFNPMLACCKQKVEKVETSYNFGPPTEVARRKLDIEQHEMLLAGNNIFFAGGRPVGHSFMQLPLSRFAHLELDLTKNAEVSRLMNEEIFDLASFVSMRVNIVLAEGNLPTLLQVEGGTPVLFLEEMYFGQKNIPLARGKYYFLPAEYDVFFPHA